MKKIILMITAVIICIAISACGEQTIDIEQLSQQLISEGTFGEELFRISDDIAQKRYGIEDGEVEECISSTGTAAVVDEVTIFKAAKPEIVKEKAEKYIESQKSSYSSYRPDEVPKLNDSIVAMKGSYVIICVSEDSSAAQNIIDEYVK